MPDLYLPDAEIAYTRTVLLAVELLDAVTLEPVARDVQVSAPPLAARPILNAGRRFVWLLAGAARPQRVVVRPGQLMYASEDVRAPDLPPDLDSLPPAERESRRLLRIWLRPRPGYRFPDGVTVLRGRLDMGDAGQDANQAAEVWLEWLDDHTRRWRDRRERMLTRTGRDGEFVAFLRLTAPDKPARGKDGRIRVRLGAKNGAGEVRHSKAFRLTEGSQAGKFEIYLWDKLTAVQPGENT